MELPTNTKQANTKQTSSRCKAKVTFSYTIRDYSCRTLIVLHKLNKNLPTAKLQ